MTFRYRLKYLIVKQLAVSNVEANTFISNGSVKINGTVVFENVKIEIEDDITCSDACIQKGKKMFYFAFNKPQGIEVNMQNPAFRAYMPAADVFPVGRLDKASEGLMILTNDGRIYNKILRHENNLEKEYLVEVDQEIDDLFISKMASGVAILGKTTLKCFCEKINQKTFRIILVQGLNRQIRRMCYKLGYEVTALRRIRIGSLHIENLASGSICKIEKSTLNL